MSMIFSFRDNKKVVVGNMPLRSLNCSEDDVGKTGSAGDYNVVMQSSSLTVYSTEEETSDQGEDLASVEQNLAEVRPVL